MEIKRKGYSFVEILICTSVAMILLSVFISIFVDIFRENEEINMEYNNRVCFDEFVRFIELEINSEDNISIEIYNEKLVFNKRWRNKDTVYCESKYGKLLEDIYIKYYKSYNSKTTKDILLKNTSYINYSLQNELLFIEVKFKSGEVMERCIGSNMLSLATY